MNKTFIGIASLLAAICLVGFLLSSTVSEIETDRVEGKNPDQTSYSNMLQIKTTHFHLEIEIDFEQNQISGVQQLQMTALESNVNRVDLDIDEIQVISVYEATQGQLKFEIAYPDVIVTGEQLRIYLAEPTTKDQKYVFFIEYSVQNSSASSWLTPQQTASKILPYLFTQCESTYCRSLAPFQDTPVIKSTYSANVTVIDSINVFLSANLTHKAPHVSKPNYQTFGFKCDIPIPSYLFTIVAGNIVEVPLGERTGVISEPTNIDFYAEELSNLEQYLNTLEEFTIPYVWGTYKIVILPPSFPFGGMENPLVTFASPSIMVGDKSAIPVAIHEIAHSWTGNLVTCKNWRNLWINEGLTVYLERQTDLIHFGKDFYLVDATVGNDDMISDMQDYGFDSNYTSLHPYVKGTNPDDSFSLIPYEKGFQFVTYLEQLVGKSFFQEYLRAYLIHFSFQSIDYLQFKQFFTQYLLENNPRQAARILSKIDWEAWINGVGLPPVTLDFYTPVITEAKELAQAFIDLQGFSSPDNFEFFNDLSLDGKCVFLQYLIDHLDILDSRILERIDNDYSLTDSPNKELLWRWFKITITVGYNRPDEEIHRFLGSIGRIKMIHPVYAALQANGYRELALRYFEEYMDFYHPIAVLDIQKLLGL